MSNISADLDTTPPLDDRVELKCAQMFVAHGSGNVASFILAAILIAYALLTSQVSLRVIFAWGTAVLVLAFALFLFQRAAARTVIDADNMHRFVNKRMILGSLIGFIFSIAPFMLPNIGTHVQNTFMFIILSGIVTVALLSFSVMPKYIWMLDLIVMGLLSVHYLLEYIIGYDPYFLLLFATSLTWQFTFLRKGMQVSKTAIEGLVHFERLADETAAKNQVQHLAMHDDLTGLPNRRYFEEFSNHILQAADRRGTMLGLIVVDLNGFKGINDTHGHATGDLVLVRFADHLRENIRDSDFAARMGGDEFILIFENLDTVEALQNVMTKLMKPIILHIDEKNLTLQIITSLGNAIFPADGATLKQLLLVADQRMYEHKRSKVAVPI